jgi:predicted phage-related endonuclease
MNMTIERISLTDDREQWLAERRKFIGASEVATVCGEGGYASAAMLFAEKKGLRAPKQDSGPMRRGRRAEASTLDALLEERPSWKIKRAMLHLRDPELRLAATPDAFAACPDREDFGVVQCKAVSRKTFREEWLLDSEDRIKDGEAIPPIAFRLQTLTEEMLSGCQWGLIATLICGEYDWPLRIFDIPRDEVLENRIRFCVQRFWVDFLDRNIMPPLDFERDAELVKQLYPKDNNTTIDLRSNNRALVALEEFTETSAAIKRMQKQERALKAELTAMLGEHSFGDLADGRRLSWRLQHRKAYSVEATDYRVLRILNPKDVDT